MFSFIRGVNGLYFEVLIDLMIREIEVLRDMDVEMICYIGAVMIDVSITFFVQPTYCFRHLVHVEIHNM